MGALSATEPLRVEEIVEFAGTSSGFARTVAGLARRTASAGGDAKRFQQVLRTAVVLQTTLELKQLTRLFSREVGAAVPHSSMHYRDPHRDIDVSVGRSARYARSFRLFVEKQELGLLTFTRGKPFTSREVALLEHLLSSLVYPLRNALQYEGALKASLTDPLTGVYNRSVMETTLLRELGLARRHKTRLSLVILDIDGLKKVNDEYGHDMGDTLIKAVADCVTRSLRKTDIVARFGGDEFAILLSNTTRRSAARLADLIRQNVAEIACMSSSGRFMVTVSMGVASSTQKDDAKSLFLRADEALYRAKDQSGNCVQVAGIK